MKITEITPEKREFVHIDVSSPHLLFDVHKEGTLTISTGTLPEGIAVLNVELTDSEQRDKLIDLLLCASREIGYKPTDRRETVPI